MTQNGRINDFDYEPGGCGTQALVYGIIIAIIFLFSSCKSIQYVPVVETQIHHDSIYFTQVQFDSIYIKDSTYQHEFTRNDTVFSETIKWKTKYIEKLRIDTLLQTKFDSIRVPQPYPVEKKPTAWQQAKQDYGGWAILLLTLLLLYVIFKLIKRFLPGGTTFI